MATLGPSAIATHNDLYDRGFVFLQEGFNKCVTYDELYKASDYYRGAYHGYWDGAQLAQLGVVDSSTRKFIGEPQKCVKCLDFYLRSVKVPWSVGIQKSVEGLTRAPKIELRYYYRTSPDPNTEVYESCGIWDYGRYISGSVLTTYYFEANPYTLYPGSVYWPKLGIWCGTTNANQNWEYSLSSKNSSGSSGTWGNWITLPRGKSNLIHVPGTFLDAMRDYDGIKFKIS